VLYPKIYNKLKNATAGEYAVVARISSEQVKVSLDIEMYGDFRQGYNILKFTITKILYVKTFLNHGI
jgi:hypothetical protein